MKNAFAFFLLLSATASFALTGTVRRVAIEAATEMELDAAVLPRGALVYRASDFRDVRIGDGETPGGLSLWNYSALTSPPSIFPHDIHMGGHSLELNNMTHSALALGADGPLFYLRNLGSNVLTIVSGRDSSRNAIVGIQEIGTNQVKITLLHAEGSSAPAIEYCTTITNQVWTNTSYAMTRLSVDLIECLIDIPSGLPDRAFLTYRVTAPEIPLRARFRVPVDAPGYLLNGAPLSLVETDAAGLAAAAQVQSNLTTHTVASNPHSITPAMIGAATGTPIYASSGGNLSLTNDATSATTTNGISIRHVSGGGILAHRGYAALELIVDSNFPYTSGRLTLGTNGVFISAANGDGILRLVAPGGVVVSNVTANGTTTFSGTSPVYIDGNAAYGIDMGGTIRAGAMASVRYRSSNNSGYYIEPAAASVALAIVGSAGIGTNNPAVKLDVRGDALIKSNLYLGTTNAWLWTNGTNLYFSTRTRTNALTAN